LLGDVAGSKELAVSGNSDDCVIVRPPSGDDDVWFGFCESLGLWRIEAPPFTACGVTDGPTGMDGFFAALAEAAAAVRSERPDLAAHFDALLNGADD
jgi:hypothetical protein